MCCDFSFITITGLLGPHPRSEPASPQGLGGPRLSRKLNNDPGLLATSFHVMSAWGGCSPPPALESSLMP